MRMLARRRSTTISRRSGSDGGAVVAGSTSPGRARTAVNGALPLVNVGHEPPPDALHVLPVDRVAGKEPFLDAGPDVERGRPERDQDEISHARKRRGVTDVTENVADVDRMAHDPVQTGALD